MLGLGQRQQQGSELICGLGKGQSQLGCALGFVRLGGLTSEIQGLHPSLGAGLDSVLTLEDGKTSSTPPSTGAGTLQWIGILMEQEKRQAWRWCWGCILGLREGFLPGFLNEMS